MAKRSQCHPFYCLDNGHPCAEFRLFEIVVVHRCVGVHHHDSGVDHHQDAAARAEDHAVQFADAVAATALTAHVKLLVDLIFIII